MQENTYHLKKVVGWMSALSSKFEEGILTEEQFQEFLEKKNPFPIEKSKPEIVVQEKIIEVQVVKKVYRSVYDQLNQIWRHLLPSFKITEKHLERLTLPDGAQCWVVMPKPSKLGNNYFSATSRLLEMFTDRFNVKNFLARKFSGKYMVLNHSTRLALSYFESICPGGFMALPVQFGTKYRQISVREARRQMASNEFGVCPYITACLIISHPEIIINENNLSLECAGMNTRDQKKGFFENNPYFIWNEKSASIIIDHSLKTACSGLSSIVSGFYPVNES